MVPERSRLSHSNLDVTSRKPSPNTTTKHLSPLPAFEIPSFELPDFDFNPNFSITAPDRTASTDAKHTSLPASEPDKMGRARGKSLLTRRQSWMPGSKSPSEHDFPQEQEKEPSRPPQSPLEPQYAEQKAADKSRSVSGSFASLAKRSTSWISTSRSPSPSPRKEARDYISHKPQAREPSPNTEPVTKSPKYLRKRATSGMDREANKSSDSLGKLGNYLSKMKQRPQSLLVRGMTVNDGDSTASSIASSATNTRPSNAASENSNTTVPDEVQRPPTTQQPRDPLWSAFKSLDAEYSRFQAKSVHMKVGVVRNTLLPFLRKYALHPSNNTLHFAELESRASILNKWWIGLLDLLDGKANQSVAGVDRPIVLEVTTILMMRPEWRQCIPQFSPLAHRSPREPVGRKGRAHSDESGNQSRSSTADSDFLAESAEHNVRTMFVTNLVTQMGIVVDKLSQRHAPLSLVNFAGRACAYAFFFAPGVAEVLVRLWALTPDVLRRVADEFRLPRRSKGESDDLTALFPPSLENLGWSSVRAMVQSLRQAAQLPLTTAKIAWHGQWVSRWRGHDTDLFFLFCKYYYILAEEFMPPNLPLVEKGRAPAFVLVNAQLLATLDSTIHRQAGLEASMGLPLSEGADASAMALPMNLNNNISRGMNENRLIALLKDFLSTSSMAFPGARHSFAEAFMALMKAAAKRTCQFDHNACFTLCDFLEESLAAYRGFLGMGRVSLDYVDWPFWLDVCQKILDSNHTMSEVRVLSLVFSIWDVATSEQARKEAICQGWLLTEYTFNKFFNNWCPMVRAYYMRLLCWRICRNDGSANGVDIRMFHLAATRLGTVWSHYQWLRDSADGQSNCAPSTAPATPAPGKRFMIIRTEAPGAQPGLMVGFDSFSTSFNPLESTSTAPAPPEFVSPPNTDTAAYKKKWNLLGRVLHLSNGSNPEDAEPSVRDGTMAHKPAPPPKGASNPVTPPASDTDSIGSSPIYESLRYVFKFTLSWNGPNMMPPAERILTQPRLPLPAQSQLGFSDIGRPAPTRAVSGSVQSGLIEAAKNAELSETSASPRSSATMDRRGSQSPSIERISSNQSSLYQDRITTPTTEAFVHGTKPSRHLERGAKYSGRALAEWSLVVAECNSFIDRRRDEGVPDLSEVEVPSLGMPR
ncbi:hypothetical protein PG993_001482 [Apiospora rasikravindrae]|uniref:DUF1765-domain-containing protein n=1 Tax=Apiospora rasikravindrae TaxID=990691 RepID=A0ABR1UDV4_9PEZI